MSHIPFTKIIPSNNGVKRTELSLASGGVTLSAADMRWEDGKAQRLRNFYMQNGCMCTWRGFEGVTQAISESGELNGFSSEPFCNKIVLHIGTCLYMYEGGDSEPVRIEGTLPDSNSIFCFFMSKLYIYCDTHVFCLDSDFVLEECMPEAPVLYDHLSPYSMSNIQKLNVPLNLLAPVIAAKYIPTTSGSFALPLRANTQRMISVTVNGKKLESEKIVSFTPYSVALSFEGQGEVERTVIISYHVDVPEYIGYNEDFYNCRISQTFGGGSVGGGTRILFTGDNEKKGHYYKSKLQNPLFVASDEYEIIGDGCENITGLIKMYGDLIVFTEKSVYRMTRTVAENEVIFAVNQLSCGIGCDCPDSIQLVDNRVVFANSEKGLFIVDSVNDAGEHNIKPISDNILKGEGIGFLDCSKDERLCSKSIDFDRCYYLFVGNRVYMWDYDRQSYVENGSYSKAMNRLLWFIFDSNVYGIPFNLGGELVIYSQNERVFYNKSSDGQAQYEFVTCKTDFGSGMNKKTVNNITLLISSEKTDERASVVCIADGKRYYQRTIPVCEQMHSIKIDLPECCLFDFALEISGEGKLKIHRMGAQYKLLS